MKRPNRSTNWNAKRWEVRVLLVLCLLTLAVQATPPGAPARLQPWLQQLAAQQPDQPVAVIVQKRATDDRVERAAEALGGKVTADLSIINAFAARVQAKDVPQLAQLDGVRWISLDAPMVKSGGPDGPVYTATLQNAFDAAIGADRLWAEGYQGSSVTVAVVDSGMQFADDFRTSYSTKGSYRIVAQQKFASGAQYPTDRYGHGTHVGGIIGGNGIPENGAYIGIAPKVNLVNLKVSDDQGASTASNVVSALQWVLNNKSQYNIRVVNLSLNSSVAESYNTNPIDAAAEILWFNGIVVVVSAGNNGSVGALYPPANDPFVITVGATDDRGTPSIADDVLASFSAYGLTESGFAKPDLVAPGTNIISVLAFTSDVLATAHPANVVDSNYFRMSGTSMAAPMVSGVVALLLQDEPNLNPDQVKFRLKATARPFATTLQAGAGYVDAYAAVHGTTLDSANTGIMASQLLWTGSQLTAWGSVNWNSVNWNSVNWNSVNWNSVNWNSVNWNSDYWGN